MNKVIMACAGVAMLMFFGCGKGARKTACCSTCGSGEASVKLITLDPGHFHAALVQKKMYPKIDKTVHVYAPSGSDIERHMAMVNGFNERPENPTEWENVVYTGSDFLEKALAEKKGNVVVLAGNNAAKVDYILKCVENGYNVFADKPMVINPEGFAKLQQAFKIAADKGLLIYDIMTERYEVTTALQREFSKFPEIYGEQDKGTPDDPSVTKESVHHFCKEVAGAPLRRPAWFYDASVQGDAIVDVNTHLVDMIQWELFPGVTLTPADVEVVQAKTWDTPMTLAEFEESTGLAEFPETLKQFVENGKLMTKANGAFTYNIKGVYAKASVLWNVKAPEGAQDTHYSLMRGTKSALVIRQGAEQGYKATLYVEPRPGSDAAAIEAALASAIVKLQADYPGIASQKVDTGWQIVVPAALKVGHEAHFGQVMDKYLEYLENGNMPEWEVPNMLVKYHTLMEAFKMTR